MTCKCKGLFFLIAFLSIYFLFYLFSITEFVHISTHLYMMQITKYVNIFKIYIFLTFLLYFFIFIVSFSSLKTVEHHTLRGCKRNSLLILIIASLTTLLQNFQYLLPQKKCESLLCAFYFCFNFQAHVRGAVYWAVFEQM